MPYDRSAFVTRTADEKVAFDFMVEADAYIADKLFSPKPVDKAEKKIFQYDLSKLRRINTKAATNAKAPLTGEQLFTSNLTLDEYKLGAEINPRNVRDADVPSLISEQRAVKMVTNHLLLDRELIAATLATTVGNYPAGLTSALAAGSRWNDADGDPEADKVTVDNAMRNSCGMKANAVAMDESTWLKLKTSPSFRSRIQYTNGGPVGLEHVKAFFGVDFIFISTARYNTALEGAADAISSVWSDNVLFFYHNPGVGIDDVGYGMMGIIDSPFRVTVREDLARVGTAGPMKVVEVATEYGLKAGFVKASGDGDFAAGYLLRTAVT